MCLIRAVEPALVQFNLFQYILSGEQNTLQLPYFPPATGETAKVSFIHGSKVTVTCTAQSASCIKQLQRKETPLSALNQRRAYPLRRKRDLAQPYACGIEDGIGDSGRGGDGGRHACPRRRLVRASISGASENVRIGYVPQSALVMRDSVNRTSSLSARLRAAMEATPSPLSGRQPASPSTRSVKSCFYA